MGLEFCSALAGSVEAAGFKLGRLVWKHGKEEKNPNQSINLSSYFPMQASLPSFGIEYRRSDC